LSLLLYMDEHVRRAITMGLRLRPAKGQEGNSLVSSTRIRQG